MGSEHAMQQNHRTRILSIKAFQDEEKRKCLLAENKPRKQKKRTET